MLITIIISGLSLYLSMPKTSLQKCIIFQYNLTSIDTQVNGNKVPAIFSSGRLLCVDVNKEEPL
jgi:hypothetical protein